MAHKDAETGFTAMQNKNTRKPNLLALAVILSLTSAVYLPALNDNHVWWGDFALYLSHAKNITHGVPYADTGYVVNQYMPWISPQAYPPVFSYLLSPVYALFDLNLFAPKILNFSLFLLFVSLFFIYASRHLENRAAVFGAGFALALSPWFWEMKNLILSDIPFAAFAFATVLIVDHLGKFKPNMSAYWFWTVALGIMFYVTYGTRSLGITLPAALVAYDLLKLRRLRLSSLVAIALFALFYVLQSIALDIDKSYADAMIKHAMQDSEQATPGLWERALLFVQYVLGNVRDRSSEYIWIIQAYWDNGISLVLRVAMLLLTTLLALVGYVHRIRRDFSYAEVFVVVYLALLLVVPFIQGNRYLLPIVPFLLFYIFLGLEVFIKASTSRHLRFAPGVLTMFIALSYLGFYSGTSRSDLPHGVKDAAAVELYDHVMESTPEDCLIVFKKPRILSLFTGRRSMVYFTGHNVEQLWENIETSNASYLIMNTQEHSIDSRHFVSLIEQYRHRLELVFENNAFKLYRVLEAAAPENAEDLRSAYSTGRY